MAGNDSQHPPRLEYALTPKGDEDLRSANDEDDPYNARSRPLEPTACPKCRATFIHGRWTWEIAPKDAYSQVCPACRRIPDRFPAGYVTLKGAFFAANRDEIVNLIKDHEKREKEARRKSRR